MGYLKLLRTFSYLENHRNHLLIYLIISIDISHEQFAGFCTLLMRLVHNGSETRSNKGSSITIGETDDGHIFRYAKSLGLDGIKPLLEKDASLKKTVEKDPLELDVKAQSANAGMSLYDTIKLIVEAASAVILLLGIYGFIKSKRK